MLWLGEKERMTLKEAAERDRGMLKRVLGAHYNRRQYVIGTSEGLFEKQRLC